ERVAKPLRAFSPAAASGFAGYRPRLNGLERAGDRSGRACRDGVWRRRPAATGLTAAGGEVDYRIWLRSAEIASPAGTPRARGGIGRRARLRALCPQGRAGSTPVGPTWCRTRCQRVQRISRGPQTSRGWTPAY